MSDALPGLDQLRELPLPAPIPYWPQTWGWVAVGALLLAGVAWAAFAGWRHHRRNRYRRQALAELDRLAGAIAGDPLAARGLPALLKRTALAAQPGDGRMRIAALGGAAWLAYLDRDAGRPPFPDDGARLLAMLAYAPDAVVRSLDPAALQRLLAASRQWMERHHVAA
ncbi:DUF4381 domain-containing protein [Bordetella petrii]|uniref:DUF4381 domain-containing protein n=1 Tax=Bordetella petrii TaxID=94624 RepID=UPI00048E6D36|nr:DUF4381 domain-containing protein [Bordetella petrii]